MNEETLFEAALSRSPEERAAFLDQACERRPELRAAVKALLAAHAKGGNILDRPPAQTVDSGPGEARPDATGVHTPGPDEAAPTTTTAAYQPRFEAGVVIAGHYTLQQMIGEGGMGEVWVAKQTEPVKRKVALKLIKTGMDSKAVVQRFEQERQALALMDHPNIAKVLDGGLTPTGQPFFVMELVNGLPLTKFCDEARLTTKERLELFVAICQAVQHAHQKGVVHRDLKPANILVTMIDAKPVPKVIDFGVAKATAGKLTDVSMSTQFGAVIGTLEYMSPEQAGFSGEDIDTRSDIYSLGVILYELLTGLRPIDARRLRKAALTEMIRLIREEEPTKPSTRLSTDDSLPSMAALRQTDPRKLMAMLRGELDWVVMKCLQKHRARRYETASGLARDIQRYLADEAVEARPPSTSYRLRKFVRRNRGQVIAASLVMLMLVIGIIGTTWGLIRANQARREEAAQRLIAEGEKKKAEQSEAGANEQRIRAETRETLAIDAVKRFRDAVANEPELKNTPRLEGLRKTLLKEPLAFFRELRDRLQAARDTRPESLTRLAEASVQLGDLTNEIGDRHDAVIAYQGSLAIYQKLADANPTVAGYQSRLGNSHISVADVLRTTGERALALKAYDSALEIFQRLADANPDVAAFRGRLAHCLDRRGNVLSSAGKMAEAAAEHRKAQAVFQGLVDADPTVAEFRTRLAASHNSLGVLLVVTGKPAEGEAEWRIALAIRQKLVDDNPAVAEYQSNLADIHGNLGILYATHKPEEAEAESRKALAIRQKVVDDNPAVTDFSLRLASDRSYVGNRLYKTGKLVEAETEYRESLVLCNKLAVDNPTVDIFRFRLAVTHSDLGLLRMKSSKLGEADADFRKGLALYQKLADDFPADTTYRSMLASGHFYFGLVLVRTGKLGEAEAEFRMALALYQKLEDDFPIADPSPIHRPETYHELGDLLARTGRPAEAEAELRKGLALYQKKVVDNPTAAEYRSDLARTRNYLGRLVARALRFPEAFTALDIGLAIRQKLADGDPKNNEYRSNLGSSYGTRGEARVRAAQPALAAADLRRAFELWAKGPDLSNDLMFERARALALLAGLGKDAQSGVTAVESATVADQAVASLRDAINAGRAWPDDLKEPEFDPIRDREDFRKLLAELDAKTPKPREKK